MTYAGDGGKTIVEIASEMDGNLIFETTAEMDGKPDTWTTQAMYEQQGPQTTHVMEAGLSSWMAGCIYGLW